MRTNEHAAALIIAVIALTVISVGAISYMAIEGEKAAEIEPQDVLANMQDDRQESTGTATAYGNNTTMDSMAHITIKEYMLETKQAMQNASSLFDINITEITPYMSIIEDLDVHLYRLENVRAINVTAEYLKKMAVDRYNVTYFDSMSGRGWDGTIIFAQKGLYGRGILIASGATVENIGGCDVAVVTSNGPLLTYEKWKNIYQENFGQEI